MIMSYDCFLKEFKNANSSKIILKSLVTIAAPFVLIAVFLLCFLILKGILNALKRRFNLKRVCVISIITIVFFLYSAVTSSVISLFNCQTINENTLLQQDMSVKCWENFHLAFTLGYGVPVILLWTFGIPTSGILFLYFFWKRL